MRFRPTALLPLVALFAACQDRVFGVGERARISLRLSTASLATGVSAVDVHAFYLKGGAPITLLRETVPVDTGTQSVPVQIDITQCITDAGPQASRCALLVDVRLLDTASIAIDSVRIGPLDVSPRSTAEETVTLREVSSITLTGADTLFVSATGTFQPSIRASDGTVLSGRAVTWKTSDTSIATVSGAGIVTARSVGSATITANAEGKSATRPVVIEGWSPQFYATGNASCGITTSGKAYCWGVNLWGERGNGVRGPTSSLELRPTAITSTARFSRISGYSTHTCALTTTGQAFCWGKDDQGQLGVAPGGLPLCTSFDSGSTAPAPCSNTPVAVGGGLTFASIVAGSASTCAMTSGGTVYCWGADEVGELGRGFTDGLAHPDPQPILGGLTFAEISASIGYICGVTTAGQAFCWGGDFSGALGIGSTAFPSIPTAVVGGLTFRTIDTRGFFTTCGVTTASVLYCWGRNIEGQLGIGSSDGLDHVTPAQVATVTQFQSAAVGFPHSCALTAAGAAFCWGTGSFGELGTGTIGSSLTPVPVTGNIKFQSLTGAAFHTCGVAVGGMAYCWGSNAGTFGDGGIAGGPTPKAIGTPR